VSKNDLKKPDSPANESKVEEEFTVARLYVSKMKSDLLPDEALTAKVLNEKSPFFPKLLPLLHRTLVDWTVAHAC